MNYNYSYYNQQPVQPVSGNDLLDLVKPNIEAAHKRVSKKAVTFGALIPVCMVCFMAGLPLGFMVSWAFIALTPIGFFGFGFCGIMIGVSGSKTFKYKLLVTLKNEIMWNDKISINSLSLSHAVGTSSVIMLVKKMIDTGNLDGYEVIGQVGVAKRSVMARESDFAGAPAEPVRVVVDGVRRQLYNCPNCGNAITSGERFCDHCGTRL